MKISTPTGSLMRELADTHRCDIAASINGVTLLRRRVPYVRLYAAFFFEHGGAVMGCFNDASQGLFERLVEVDDLIGAAMDNMRYARVGRTLEMDPFGVDLVVELHSGKQRRLVPMRTGDVMVARTFTAWSA